MNSTWRIDDPIRIGPITLPRRVFLPAHQPGLAEHGTPGERYIAYHRQRARAGAAMQITGATPVVASSQWSHICLWNIDESIVPGYRKLGNAVRAEGGRMLAQLAHPGPTEYGGPHVFGASRDLSEPTRQVAVAATTSQLEEVVTQYAAAADRCRRGELDGVEISMAHGMLLASFLSPLTNRRDDEYGGELANRLRLPILVLDAVRAAIGTDMVLGIRLGADDLVAGGLTPADAAQIAQALQSRADYISVMVGNNNRLEARVQHWPPTPAEPGLFRNVARTVKDAVDIPVAAVGRILTLDLAHDLIDAGDADLVGMVRAQIADGEIISKSRAGRTEDVRPCIGANVCVNELLRDHPLSCMINPDARTSDDLASAARLVGHRSVVVGGGPAGMEAARRLATRGSEVTLFEALPRLGGQLAQWATAPSRAELMKWVAWQERQLDALGVDVRLNTPFTSEMVTELMPETVVLATGSSQVPTEIRVDDGSVVRHTPADAFNNVIPGGHRVLVFDEVGELDGALIAEHLVAIGHEVTLATARVHVGEGEGINTLFTMLRRLNDIGVTVVERVRPVEVSRGSVRLAGVFGGEDRMISTDSFVGWSGGMPLLDLVGSLELAGVSPLIIGDALRPRRVMDATGDAKQATDAIPGSPGPSPEGSQERNQAVSYFKAT
ncbi:oxidoreductase [Nocardioides acrostichi]|uniref:NAD-binding protein n=1 Tax=Nocardioides acrostichi TaxID=2784339 RepID=A0A930Y6A6_9ACTN|nr:NAD-binding protein [Nocardioides acrostichi]MBF4160731.1 NAD-binding protein [Nocardioides acrostichi]